MIDLIAVLVYATASFIVVHILFGVISWIYPDSDQIYRSNLDRAIEEIDQKTFFDLGKCLLIRLVEKIGKLRLRVAIPLVLIGSFLLNVIVYFTTISVVTSTHFAESFGGYDAVFESILAANIVDLLVMIMLVGSLGTIFDCLSLGITVWLIYRASIATTARSLLSHVGVDLVVALVAIAWAYAILTLTLQYFYEELQPLVRVYAGSFADRYLRPSIGSTLEVNPGLWYVVIGLGLSTAVPTMIYLLVLAPLLSFRLIPRRIQEFISLILFRITTDERPVLQQLGRISKGASVVIGATVALLMP